MKVVEDTENSKKKIIEGIPVYNPASRYTWDPNAEFILTGKEFGLWLNTIRGIVSSKEAIQIRMALECNEVLEELMAKGVAAGHIVELPKPEQS